MKVKINPNNNIIVADTSGLSKFYKKLLSDVFRYIKNKDYDLMILILGAEGSGKSTLSLRTAMYFNYLNEKKYYFDLNYLYIDKIDLTTFFDNINEKPLKVHIFDEAHNLLSSSDTSTTISKNLINFFKTSRALRQIYILNTINIDINADILRRTDIIIITHSRGYASLYFNDTKNKLIIELLELKRRYSRSFNVSTAVEIAQTQPQMIIKYKPIDPEEFQKYYDIKMKRMLEHKEIIKQSIINKLEKENLISITDIKKQYTLTNTQLAQLLEILEETNSLIRSSNKTYAPKEIIDKILNQQ